MIGHRPLGAHVDGKPMTSAQGAPDLADQAIQRLRALGLAAGQPTAGLRAAGGTALHVEANWPLPRAMLASPGIARTRIDVKPSSPTKMTPALRRGHRPRGTPRGADLRGTGTAPTRNRSRMRVRPTCPLHAQEGRASETRRQGAMRRKTRPAWQNSPLEADRRRDAQCQVRTSAVGISCWIQRARGRIGIQPRALRFPNSWRWKT